MTSQSRRLPGAVLMAANDLRSHNGRNDWLRRLEQHGLARISHPTAFTGGNGELDDIQLLAPEEIDKTQDTPEKPGLNYQSRRGSAFQRQPKAFGGVIASSEQGLKDLALMERIAAGNDILCFETAAANMKSRLFMVISGIASCSGDKQQELPSNEVCKIVASYVACLVHRIDPTKLAAEFPIASYFEYEAFDLNRPGFRLLRLEAGIGPVRCHIFQAYLDDEDSLIPYDALSYCWGSNRLTGTVIVNEKVLFITENLSEALRHLRHRDEDRILWIDAICIDQNNIRERGHQVGCMGRIYSHAHQVLIWLGRVKYELSHLISALKEFEARVPPGAWRNWSYGDPRWYDVWEKAHMYLLGGHESDRISQQSRLKLLMSKPWLYALLDLASDMKIKERITADYTKDEEAVVKDVLAYLFNDDPSSNGFLVRDIADLQRKIPNLSCMALERMILRGAQITDIQEFLQLQTKTVWLSEEAASYAWCVDTTLMDYLLNEPTFEHIAMRSVSETSILKSDFTVECFLNRRKKKVKITRDIIRTAGRNGIDLPALVVEESRDDIEITEPLVEEAVRKGSDILKLLLDRRGDEVKITEAIVKEAARTGSDNLKLLLDRRGYEVKITQAIVEEAARTGSDTLKLLLDRRGHGVKITETIVEEAARTGRGDEVKITEAIVEEAARTGSDTLKLLLDRCGDKVKITEAIVEEAARTGSNTLKFLLDRRGKEIKITRNITWTARQNGIDLLVLVVEKNRDDIEITEALVEEATRKGSDILKLLFDRYGDEVKITEAIVKEAARTGSNTLKFLLDRRGKEIKITRNITWTARQNGIDLLVLVVEENRDDIEITEALVEEAARKGSDILKLLLDRRGDEVKITEAIVKEAARAGSDTLKFLLDRRGKDIKISRDIIQTAYWNGIDLLALVMEEGRDDVEITEALVEKAVRTGSNTLKFLLDRRGKDIKISKDIIYTAYGNRIDLLALVLEESRNDVEITEALIEEAVWKGSNTLKLLLDKRGKDIKISRDIIQTADWKGIDLVAAWPVLRIEISRLPAGDQKGE
ncbi:hypothetical protein DL768_008620 [Monosporascus sp. mg162]|nr:hypothetical protein DL768_008620 [Monosporascus sp. mg162]